MIMKIHIFYSRSTTILRLVFIDCGMTTVAYSSRLIMHGLSCTELDTTLSLLA